MKVASFEIVFQEVPGEVTLALNISGCPNRCKGCHSPHLWEDTGEDLTTELLDALVDRYFPGITCVCFMGGDQDADYVVSLSQHVHDNYPLKTAWYTGQNLQLSESSNLQNFHTDSDDCSGFCRDKKSSNLQIFKSSNLSTFDFVKTGPYVESLGGLKSPTTNQRFYRRDDQNWIDETSQFHSKTPHTTPSATIHARAKRM